MSCLLIAAPPGMLNELAKGPIRTWWGDAMKAERPAEKMDEIFHRLEKEEVNFWAITAFLVGAPLLAERLAIAEYKLKVPDFGIVAPEVLSYQEALSIALMDMAPMSLNEDQRSQAISLLKNDQSMKVIH